jgi:hypothetical protein
VKDQKKIYQANGPQKLVRVTTPISDKVDFKLTLIKHDKEGYFIQIKGKYIRRKEQLSTYMHPMSLYPISSNIL